MFASIKHYFISHRFGNTHVPLGVSLRASKRSVITAEVHYKYQMIMI